MIPAIEEQKAFFNKKLEIARGFWFSLERIAKELWVHRTDIYDYIGGRIIKTTTYLGANDKLEKFILSHLETNKSFYLQKIEEIEEKKREVLKMKNI